MFLPWLSYRCAQQQCQCGFSHCRLCLEKVIPMDNQVLHADVTGTNIAFTSPPPLCSLLPLSLFPLPLTSFPPSFYRLPSPSAPFAPALSGLPSFVKSPEDQTGISGGVASFVCQATGEPKPRITWMKKGKKVSSQRFEVSTHAWLSDLWNTRTPTGTHINTSRHKHNTRDKTLQAWASDCLSNPLINRDTSTHTHSVHTKHALAQRTQSIALLLSITPTLLFSERDQTGFPPL